MAVKVLGQSAPAAATLTPLYTVPGGKLATCSSLMICNTSSTPTTVRVSVAVAGAADAIGQYVYYNLPIAGSDTFIFTGGMCLAATDVLRVYSVNGLCNFILFGDES